MRPLPLYTLFCAAVLTLLPRLPGQTVVNGGFESPVYEEGNFEYAGPELYVDNEEYSGPEVPGWTFTGRAGVSSANSPWTPQGGASSQFAFLQIGGDSYPASALFQTVRFNTAGTFTLSYLAGRRNLDFDDNPTAVNYSISLTRTFNSSVVFSASEAISGGQEVSEFSYTVSLAAVGDYELRFTVDDMGELSDRAMSIDSVAFASVAAIPEPSTYAAMAGGAVLLGTLWRRRRQRAASA